MATKTDNFPDVDEMLENLEQTDTEAVEPQDSAQDVPGPETAGFVVPEAGTYLEAGGDLPRG